jgi:hypothetical protein
MEEGKISVIRIMELIRPYGWFVANLFLRLVLMSRTLGRHWRHTSHIEALPETKCVYLRTTSFGFAQ